MILIRVSIPELSLLCFSAKKHSFKKKILFIYHDIVLENPPLCSSAEGKFLNLGFYAL